MKNSFGKCFFQNLDKIEMIRNKNRHLAAILKRYSILELFCFVLFCFVFWHNCYLFLIARTNMMQIALQNSGGKVVFSGEPPSLGTNGSKSTLVT